MTQGLAVMIVLWAQQLDPAPVPASPPVPAAPAPPAGPAAPEPSCFPPCRSGFLCWSGRCVSACNPPCGPGYECAGTGLCVPSVSAPPAAATPVASSPPAGGGGEALIRRGLNAHVNPAGGLMYGLTAGLELGDSTSYLLRGRIVNAGLAADEVNLSDLSHESLNFSFGIAVGMRRYLNSLRSQSGTFLGLAAEYLDVGTETYMGTRYRARLVAPELETGYRWLFGSFSLAVGAGMGYALVVNKTMETFKVPNYSWTDAQLRETYPNEAESAFFLELNVELGVFM